MNVSEGRAVLDFAEFVAVFCSYVSQEEGCTKDEERERERERSCTRLQS